MAEADQISRLEARVTRLEDIEEIKQLKVSYAQYLDDGFARGRFERADVDELFAPDAHWLVTGAGGEARGRDGIHELFDQMRSAVTWSLHYMIAPKVTLDASGETASGEFYLLCLDTQPREDDPNRFDATVLTLRYVDEFVKLDGRWFIKSLRGEAYNSSDWTEGWVRQQWRPGTGPGSGNLGSTYAG